MDSEMTNADIEFVYETPDVEDETYKQFEHVFQKFNQFNPDIQKTSSKKEDSNENKDESDPSNMQIVEASEPPAPLKPSKKKLKQEQRMSVVELKQKVARPELVEFHDVTAKDPILLLALKGTKNTVPVPRHWSSKRRYLQGKRGYEKPPFFLPDFIRQTGIMEMRDSNQEKDSAKSLKSKMREKIRPKVGKIQMDYQQLHDAFFKWQTKPKLTIHGDLYHEGKEFEKKFNMRPGELSEDLRKALGMPVGPGSEKFPPPWFNAMKRHGPPPSYPYLPRIETIYGNVEE